MLIYELSICINFVLHLIKDNLICELKDSQYKYIFNENIFYHRIYLYSVKAFLTKNSLF